MTPAQAEAMDAVSHMTIPEIKEFTKILAGHLERRLIYGYQGRLKLTESRVPFGKGRKKFLKTQK